jgi:hypothetical protein
MARKWKIIRPVFRNSASRECYNEVIHVTSPETGICNGVRTFYEAVHVK